MRNFGPFYFFALACNMAFGTLVHAFEPQEGSPQAAIEKKVNALVDKAQSTADQIKAADTGTQLWDAELNRVYQALLKGLHPEGQKALKASQKAWLASRDQQFLFIAEMYSKYEGTMYLPMQVHAKMSVIRSRALELAGLLAMQKEHGQQ